jgi:hypothetical protein
MREFLDDVKRHGHAKGNFLGLLNVLIGRRIEKTDGKVLSVGLTWREAAGWLKKIRWDKDAFRELGIDPAKLPPRDRQRYWYHVISLARVDSPEAAAAGDRLAEVLAREGYVVK